MKNVFSEGSINKQVVIYSLAILILLTSLFCALLFYQHTKGNELLVDNFSTDIRGFLFNIDEVVNEESFFIIDGWACRQDEEIKKVLCWVVLKDIEENKYFKINTLLVKRKDVTQAIADGVNYDNSGFTAKINKSLLKKNTQYQIYILYLNNDNQVLINTNKNLSF